MESVFNLTRTFPRNYFEREFWPRRLDRELKSCAEKETEQTGHTLTKSQLAREIFFWAWDLYKAAGSLAALKQVDVAKLFPKPKPADVIRFPGDRRQ